MAAVAGSKGRISATLTHSKRATHVSLLYGLIAGRSSVEETAKTIVSSAQLREIGIDTNMICNLDCRYCYLKKRPEAKGSLSADYWANRLVPLIYRGAKLIAFIGKEPLADQIALDVLHKLNELRKDGLSFRTGMVTNGTLVPRQLDRLLSSGLSFLDVSLDHISEGLNALRGNGVASRARDSVEILDRVISPLCRSVACVLHQKNIDGFGEMVEWVESLSQYNLFASPILDFTDSRSEIDPLSVSVLRIRRLIESVLDGIAQRKASHVWGDRQIIIDLPYSYSWSMLLDGTFDLDGIQEDEFAAHFVKPIADAPLYIKLNLLPLSYWRAARITHDGRIVEDMDLAAHAAYEQVSRPITEMDCTWLGSQSTARGVQHLTDFLHRYWTNHAFADRISDRFVSSQFDEHVAHLAA
jgi:Radical SAM superfamily